MQSWLAKQLISHVMAHSRAGDIRPTLLLDAPDVELTFPGESSFSGAYRGKKAVARWLERFAALGIQIYADEVVVKGFPWRSTVCVRGRDQLRGDDGELIYKNRYVIWGRMAWGRLKQYEVYEDTVAPVKLDAWLAEHRPPLAAVG